MELDLHGNLATTETEVATGGVELQHHTNVTQINKTIDIIKTSKYIK